MAPRLERIERGVGSAVSRQRPRQPTTATPSRLLGAMPARPWTVLSRVTHPVGSVHLSGTPAGTLSPALLRREYRFAFNRPARAVSPKPGVSCAMASAPSSLERRRMTRDQDEDEAPKPWFMWRTHRGGGATPPAAPSVPALGSSRR